MPETKNPIRDTNDEARQLARSLIRDAKFGALAVLGAHGTPHVTRIAMACTDKGQPFTLISDLSSHTKALKENPVCSLLLGEPGAKGDPLTHPRITLSCQARIIPHADPAYATLKPTYLAQNPKAGLYIGFADFNFALFDVASADLNGGFGQAYKLSAQDLGL